MSPPDLDRFRLPSKGEPRPGKPKQIPRHKTGEWFVKGPIPGEWLSEAAKLPGRVLHVGVALWFAAGLSKQREVKLTRQLLARFGIKPDAGRWALKKLETAGLVSVHRTSGRSPIVTIEPFASGKNSVAIPSRSAINDAGRASALTPERP